MEPNFVSVNDSLNDDSECNEWIHFGMKLGVGAAMYPFEYAKALIQLGYEPIPARPGRSFLGRQQMLLPNIFQYAAHIRKVDGFYGCYRGLAPKLIGSMVSMILSEKIASKLGMLDVEEKDDSDMSDEQLYIHFKISLKRKLVVCAAGIVVSHPFQVISLRMMAQFIGRETLYKSILSSILEIYRTEGIFGFFSGLSPKLLCEIATLTLSSSAVFVVNKYLVKDKLGRTYIAGVAQYIFAALLYPLQVVSTCMAVTGSRLMAGQPPIMPVYNNWMDCWNDLQARKELKRGSSIFWRSAGGVKLMAVKNNYAPLPVISRY